MLNFIKWLFGIEPAVKKPHEIEIGIPKPSFLLAGMLCAKIIQHYHVIKQEDAKLTKWCESVFTSEYYRRWTWTYDNVVIEFNVDRHKSIETDSIWSEIKSIKFNGQNFKFDKEDEKQIWAALVKARKHQIEVERQKEFYEREMRAVELIDGFFKRTPNLLPRPEDIRPATLENIKRETLRIQDMSQKAQLGYNRLTNRNYKIYREYEFTTSGTYRGQPFKSGDRVRLEDGRPIPPSMRKVIQ